MLFADTCDIPTLDRLTQWGVTEGVTTNPLILQKQLGIEPKAERIKRVLAAHRGPVSVQLTETSLSAMLSEAAALRALSTRIVAKVPFSEDGLRVIHALTSGKDTGQAMTVNATAIMTFGQAYLAAKAGAQYVSFFWNRIRDVEMDPQFAVRSAREVFDKQRMNTKIITGSIRAPHDVREALKAGSHIVTVPPGILEQMLFHPQTEKVMEQFGDAARESA